MSLFVHEFPGPSFRFQREQAVSDYLGVAANVGAVFAAFAPVMTPLVVEVDLGLFEPALGMLCYDEAVQEHRRALAAAGRSDGIAVAIRAERVETHDAVTPALIADWLVQQLENAGGERCLGVVELAVTASEAFTRDLAGQGLRTRPGDVEVPTRRVDAGAWLGGPVPAAPGQPPVRLVIRHDFNQLETNVGVEWSWWSVGPGREDLDRALALLEEDGWLRS